MLDAVPTITEIIIAVVIVLISLAVGIVILKKKPGKKVKAKVLGKSRTHVAFVGLVGAGKTTMLLKMKNAEKADDDLPETFTSMAATSARLTTPDAGKTVKIVDFPGHRRLRDTLLDTVEESKALVCVVDSVNVNDDKEGAASIADLLSDLVKSSQFKGVKAVLIACTKRDEITSFSAKAIRKLLEKEIARQISTKSGSVGSLTNKDESQYNSTEFIVDENGKFSFDFCDIPFTFANVCSRTEDPEHCNFDLKPVWEFLEEYA